MDRVSLAGLSCRVTSATGKKRRVKSTKSVLRRRRGERHSAHTFPSVLTQLMLTAISALFLATCVSAARQNPTDADARQAWRAHLGPPPPTLICVSFVDLAYPSESASGRVWCAVSREGLEIHWKHATARSATQHLALPYWPTAVARASSTALFVGGKRRDGNTLIERISIAPPLIVNTAAAPELQFRAPSSIQTVYDRAERGKDMVVSMQPSLFVAADRPNLLVHFHDSLDIYELVQAAAGAPVAIDRVAGPVAPGGGCGAPIWAGDHIEKGYVYVYGGRITTILIDCDRDGRIDGSDKSSTTEEWVEKGFASSDSYRR
jgi:hypothetical protein